MKKAIFLDRDGTIIKDRGYIDRSEKVLFYDFTFECLRQLQKSFLLFIVTNQSGISKGLIRKKGVDEVHSYILQRMRCNGVRIADIYCCPHRNEDNCACKKPKTYFIDKAVRSYGVDVSASYVIGDHPSDAELAVNANANGIYVLTGHGRRHYGELGPGLKSRIRICRNLASVARGIIRNESS
ncbi:MAG: HAD family hydrolase [Bacteroidota bacterium]